MRCLQIEIELEVPFHDVDVMGIVWHGHYVKYFELARTALMRKAGMDLPEMLDTHCAWPVVSCELKYLKPLRYAQRVRVEAVLLEFEERLKIAYTIRGEDGARLTRGTTVQLAVDAESGALCFETPPALVAAIRQALG